MAYGNKEAIDLLVAKWAEPNGIFADPEAVMAADRGE